MCWMRPDGRTGAAHICVPPWTVLRKQLRTRVWNAPLRMFTNMCTYYEVPIYFFGKKSEIGHAMGKEMRASLVILDAGFAKAVVKLLNTNGGSKYESI